MKKQDSFQHWLCSHRSGVSPQNSDLEMGDTKVHVLIHGTTSLTGDGGKEEGMQSWQDLGRTRHIFRVALLHNRSDTRRWVWNSSEFQCKARNRWQMPLGYISNKSKFPVSDASRAIQNCQPSTSLDPGLNNTIGTGVMRKEKPSADKRILPFQQKGIKM